MRIAFIGSHADYMRRFRGGVIRELSCRGHDVHCLAPGARTVDWSEVPATIHDVQMQRTSLSPLADAQTLNRLRRALAAIAPDLVIAYSAKPIAYGLRAAQHVGVPRRIALFTGLGSFIRPTTGVSRVASAFARRALRDPVQSATRVLCQNPDDLEYVRNLGWTTQERSAVAPATGVDLAYFAAQPTMTSPSALFVGRLVREKGVHDFVAAASLVRRQIPRATFSVAGMLGPAFRGVGRRKLQRWVAAGAIRFLGWQTDLRPVLGSHSVFVLPSVYGEGVPRSGQEALASGRPVVTTDWPGCRELIGLGNEGALVPPNDPGAIAAMLIDLFNDPSRLAGMQQAARARAEACFDADQTSKRLATLLESDSLADVADG